MQHRIMSNALACKLHKQVRERTLKKIPLSPTLNKKTDLSRL